jgi:hypothetical protein
MPSTSVAVPKKGLKRPWAIPLVFDSGFGDTGAEFPTIPARPIFNRALVLALSSLIDVNKDRLVLWW